jgi:two-component system, NtrC family, sensor kinase
MAKGGRKAKKRATATKRKKTAPQPGSGKPKSIKTKSIKPKSSKLKSSSSKASNSRSGAARLKSELRAARDRQAASAEVMRLISASPGDADQTLLRIAEIAERLFGASSVSLLIADGEHWGRTIRVGAGSERIASAIPLAHVAITPQFMPGAVYLENRQVHVSVDDPVAMARWPGLTPARAAGTRTMSGTPLRSEGRAIGALIVHRDRPVPFTEDDLALLQSFADQAVIATENARLFNETREALERQTATADILKVIASSPSDVQPVFEAIAASSNRLIGGYSTAVLRFVDDELHLAAFTPVNPKADEVLKATFPRPLSEFPHFMLVRDGETQQFADTEAQDVSPVLRNLARLRGYRSMLFTPLMNNDKPIGIISVTRKEPGTFAAHHIQLVRTFADQAVIAVENVRLFDEVQAKTADLSESLLQQTVIGDVLKTISRSSFDLQPVLEALVESAARLCDAEMAYIMRREGDVYRAGAAVGYSEEYVEFLKQHPLIVDRGTITGRAAIERHAVQILDVATDPDYKLVESTSLGRQHTALGVPLLRENEPIGVIVLARQRVQAFTSKQIELVTTFADQAVIAIENVRLFNETREALERQTATAEILKVIASSPSDLQPVFEAIASSANRLINGFSATVVRFIGNLLHLVAFTPTNAAADEALQASFPRPLAEFAAFDLVRDGETVQFPDTESEDVPPVNKEMARLRGYRSMVFTPLMSAGTPIGILSVTRVEPGTFAARHVQLLRTFADQAAIAIENAQLFEQVQARTSDLQESLEYQTATSDVLQVISRSTFDLQTVLDTLVESAYKLCGANLGLLYLRGDEAFECKAIAGTGVAEASLLFKGRPIGAGRGTAAERVILTGEVQSITDFFEDPEMDPKVRETIRNANSSSIGQIRSTLAVPMMRDHVVIGVMVIARSQTGPFPPRQIELLRTFADQAVIAIENARLFDEVQARTEDLRESLQQQTATADVLKVISRSAFDLKSVLTTLTESAQSLCGASLGIICLRDGEVMRLQAESGCTQAFIAFMQANPIRPGRETITGRVFMGGKAVHVADVLLDPEYNFGQAPTIGAYRSVLAVPLMRDGAVEGVLLLGRPEPGTFSQRQIDLVQTFADQAVIAIENVRLFEQVQERTKELSLSLDELRTAQDRLVQTEKLASLGQLTAGIAHEIKNPLNFVNNFSSLSAELIDELNDALKPAALDDKVREEIDELTQMLKGNLEKVVQHGKRADSIVKNMLLHSREGSGEHRLADINAIVEESLNLAYHGARAERSGFNITLQRDLDPAAGMIDLYPQEITRVFLNLISNGFYATAKRKAAGGEGFEPTLRATTKDLGNEVEIRIRDNGTGIPLDVKEKMFNPFFTTKPAGEGTGLGLSMSHDIVVKQHGGKIDVDTMPGAFTEFIITLPRMAAQLQAGGTN